MNMCLCVGTLEFKVLVNELVNVSECVFMSVGDFVNVSECKECVNVCPEYLCVTTWTSVCTIEHTSDCECH